MVVSAVVEAMIVARYRNAGAPKTRAQNFPFQGMAIVPTARKFVFPAPAPQALSALIRFAILWTILGRSIRGAGAFAQSRAQVNRPAMLFQNIGERFIGQFLKRHHAIARQQIERRPTLVVQLHALAGHLYVTLTRLFLRNLLAFFSRLGQTDGDGLLAAFNLTALTAFAAFGGAPLVAMHLAFDVGMGASGIFAFPFGHNDSLIIARARGNPGAAYIRQLSRM